MAASAPLGFVLPLLMGLAGYLALHHLWIWGGRREERVPLWTAAWSANTVLYLGSLWLQGVASRGDHVVTGSLLAWTSALVLAPVGVGLAHALGGRSAPRGLLAGLAGASTVLAAVVWTTELLVTRRAYVRTDALGQQYGSLEPGPALVVLAPYFAGVFAYGAVTLRRGTGLARGERRAILVAFAFYIAFAVNDVLHSARIVQTVRLFPYAFVAVALGLTWLLVRRYASLRDRLADEVRAATAELREQRAAAERRREELAALLRAGHVVMGGLDLATTLARIVDEAGRIAGTPHVKVLLVDPDTRLLHLAAASGGTVPAGFTVPVGTSYSGTVAATGQPLFVPDTPDDPANLLAERDRAEGIRTYLGLPIRIRDEVLGVLTFNTETPRRYTADELAYLGSFADQAAVAIDNARLYASLQARADRRQTLTRLTHLISASLDPDTVFREVLVAVARLMDVPVALLWATDDDRRTARLRALSDPAYGDFPLVDIPYAQGIVGWIAVHRQAVGVPDVHADDRFVALDWWRRHGLAAFHGVPIVLDDRLLAVVALNAPRPIRLDADRAGLLDALVAQAAVAIRNAALHEAQVAARREAETALAQVKQLQGLLPICAYCKKVRNDRNYWEQIETYIGERSEATFSHGICPDCRARIVEPELQRWRDQARPGKS
jgi:GAF domain-containing protein